MTTFNTDYNNTELLDQELTIEQLEAVAGGGVEPKTLTGSEGGDLALGVATFGVSNIFKWIKFGF
jgi:hypothetical protein